MALHPSVNGNKAIEEKEDILTRGDCGVLVFGWGSGGFKTSAGYKAHAC